MRVPVHQPLVAIDQAVPVQLHEHLADGGVQPFVQGEAFARPVARRPQPAQLAHNGAARVGLPLPDLVDERLAAHVAPPDIAGGGQLALDHHLGGDARMVRAGQPQHRLAGHPVIAGQDVLQRIVQRVADVERARHVRRRNDDRIGPGGAVGRGGVTGGEQAAVLPRLVQAGLGALRFEILLKHRGSFQMGRLAISFVILRRPPRKRGETGGPSGARKREPVRDTVVGTSGTGRLWRRWVPRSTPRRRGSPGDDERKHEGRPRWSRPLSL